MLEVPTYTIHRELVHHRVLRELGPLDIHLDRVPIDTALAGDMVFQRYERLGASGLSWQVPRGGRAQGYRGHVRRSLGIT